MNDSSLPDGIDALGVAAPGVYPPLGQEAVLVLGLEVLRRFKPAAAGIVFQSFAMEHGLVCWPLPGLLCCICLVLGYLQTK